MDALRPATRVFPLIILLIVIEAILIYRRKGSLPKREMIASFLVLVGQKAISSVMAGTIFGVYLMVWKNRFFTIPLDSSYSWMGLFFLVEFIYYWFHRWSHESRWLWASHSVHHSATHFNLSAAYRLGWTGFISGVWLFWIPVVALGFHPVAVVSLVGINLLYQFWLHTEIIPPLGGFELFFNSPSLHRVHHASNKEYLDKNYGGILIIYDRMFGTYQPEKKSIEIRYGLLGVPPTINPFRIAFQEWIQMAKDLPSCRSGKEVFLTLFGRPGLTPVLNAGSRTANGKQTPRLH